MDWVIFPPAFVIENDFESALEWFERGCLDDGWKIWTLLSKFEHSKGLIVGGYFEGEWENGDIETEFEVKSDVLFLFYDYFERWPTVS